jgi:hypothetical protein
MADITDPKLISWSNSRARPLADKMTSLLAALLAYQADYAAQSISATITADGAANNIGDGYATDGRNAVTGTMLVNFKAAVDQVVTAMNVTLVSGVGATVASVENGIQVNGSSR